MEYFLIECDCLIFCLLLFSFFINHQTKTTSWEDPRQKLWQQQQQQQQQHAYASGGYQGGAFTAGAASHLPYQPSPSASGAAAHHRSRENIQMQEMSSGRESPKPGWQKDVNIKTDFVSFIFVNCTWNFSPSYESLHVVKR